MDALPLSRLALGGLLLGAFATLGAAGLLVVSRLSPNPLFLILPALFIPMGGAAAAMGWLGARRSVGGDGAARMRGRGLGMAGVGLGLLAGLVIAPVTIASGFPAFRRYQLESREQQALHFISQLRMGAMSHRHENGGTSFPRGDSGWIPEAAPTPRRYPYRAELWTTEPWSSLDFRPSAAHFHQYRYRDLRDGAGFVVAARGDLDGDGQWATYTATVVVREDGRVQTLGPTRSPPDAR
ncbi:MAG: hypothetical protein AAFZ18_14975 [Myxococcota bacterium]